MTLYKKKRRRIDSRYKIISINQKLLTFQMCRKHEIEKRGKREKKRNTTAAANLLCARETFGERSILFFILFCSTFFKKKNQEKMSIIRPFESEIGMG